MRSLKRHIFTHVDNVVVGSSPAAFLFAHKHKHHIVFKEPQQPFFFEKFTDGIEKRKIYEMLLIHAGIDGRILGVNNQTIRFDEKTLKIITGANTLLNYKIKKAYIFDPTMVNDLRVVEKKDNDLFVLDQIYLNCEKHQQVYHYVGDDFVKELHFYKDATKHFVGAASYLKESQLHDFDYGDVTLIYKVKNIMKNVLGMRGNRNGRSMEDPTKYKYYALKAENKRRITRNLTFNEYEKRSYFKYMRTPEEKLWKEIKPTFATLSELSQWLVYRSTLILDGMTASSRWHPTSQPLSEPS